MSEPARGAGRAGGLLFLGVLAFVGLLVVDQTGGAVRLIAVVVLAAAALAVGVSVVRRR